MITQGKSNQGIITQGKITQSNNIQEGLSIVRLPRVHFTTQRKNSHGRGTKGKFIITQGKDKVNMYGPLVKVYDTDVHSFTNG